MSDYSKITDFAAKDALLSGNPLKQGKGVEVDNELNAISVAIASKANKTSSNTFTANQLIYVTDDTNAALRITQLGTGNALLIEDETSTDATPFVIDASGRCISGHTASISGIGAHPQPFQAIGKSIATGYSAGVYSTTGVTSPIIQLFRSKSATIGAHTAVVNTDNLGYIRFGGSDGTNFETAAQIAAKCDGTVSTGIVPGLLVFSTANYAGSVISRFQVDSNGQFAIITNTTGAAISQTSPAKFLVDGTTYTDNTTAGGGTVALASFSSFLVPTIASSNASVTYTKAAAVYIGGAPTAGTNVTITTPLALQVNSGNSVFGGGVSVGSTNAPVAKLDVTGDISATTSIYAGNEIVSTTATPITVTGSTDSPVLSRRYKIYNRATAVTVTMPAAASYPGKEYTFLTINTGTVVSASSNIIPITGGAAGTAILGATAGKWCTLVSDGTNWQIMAAN